MTAAVFAPLPSGSGMMDSTTTATATSNHASLDADEESETDEIERLGIGSSASLANGLGGKLLSVQSLIDSCKPTFKTSTKYNVHNEKLPYEPINAAQSSSKAAVDKGKGKQVDASTPNKSSSSSVPPESQSSTPSTSASSLFPKIPADPSWPPVSQEHGLGMGNLGNTCFLNSALQCLLHTPPLVRYLSSGAHLASCLYRQHSKFCPSCSLILLIKNSADGRTSALNPRQIVSSLKTFAKHFRQGRQEDSHEFLRFFLDAMQNAELTSKTGSVSAGSKLPQKVKETTFVHQIFGGRLRSRVLCSECDHPSDTFDSFLDLSLDISHAGSIRDALQQFVRIDRLAGKNKYKCERCKKLVVAEKSFSIDDAPMALTIHLKRFNAFGRKITDTIKYPEVLHLGPYMSDSSRNPTYRLYGIVQHLGGGPHSGHYTALIRGSKGDWFEMDDSHVQPINSFLNRRNAYVLFYIREKGQALDDALHAYTTTTSKTVAPSQSSPKTNCSHHVVVNGTNNEKKRSRDDQGEQHPNKRTLITPSSSKAPPSPDPTAVRAPFAPASSKVINGPSAPFKPPFVKNRPDPNASGGAYRPGTFEGLKPFRSNSGNKNKYSVDDGVPMSIPKNDHKKRNGGPKKFAVVGQLQRRTKQVRRP